MFLWIKNQIQIKIESTYIECNYNCLLSIFDDTSRRIRRWIARRRRRLVRRRRKDVRPVRDVSLTETAGGWTAAATSSRSSILPADVFGRTDVVHIFAVSDGKRISAWTGCRFVRQKILLWWIGLWQRHKCVAILSRKKMFLKVFWWQKERKCINVLCDSLRRWIT